MSDCKKTVWLELLSAGLRHALLTWDTRALREAGYQAAGPPLSPHGPPHRTRSSMARKVLRCAQVLGAAEQLICAHKSRSSSNKQEEERKLGPKKKLSD